MIFSISHPFPSQKRKFTCASEWVGRTDYSVPSLSIPALFSFLLSSASSIEVLPPLSATFRPPVLISENLAYDIIHFLSVSLYSTSSLAPNSMPSTNSFNSSLSHLLSGAVFPHAPSI